MSRHITIKMLLFLLIGNFIILFFQYRKTPYDTPKQIVPTIETIQVLTNDTLAPFETLEPIPEETVVEEELIIEETESTHKVTQVERDMLASLVYLESGSCSIDTQIAVASIVFNRLESGKWNRDMNNDGIITLYDIVYYPNAFSVARNISTTSGNESSYTAVDYVIKYGSTIPLKVCFFRSSYDFDWPNYKHYSIMNNLYFGYIWGD